MANLNRPLSALSSALLTKPMRASLGVFAFVLCLDGVFFINLCDLIYTCGCRSLFAGAATMCNVHAQSPPHCPWCAQSWSGALVFLGTSGTQALLIFGTRFKAVVRLGLAVGAFAIVGGALGILIGFATGYWG